MAACSAPCFFLPGTVYRLFVLVFSSFIRQLYILLIMADLYFFGNLHWTNPALAFHFLTFLSILFFYKKILLSEFKIFFDWHLELRIHNLYLCVFKRCYCSTGCVQILRDVSHNIFERNLSDLAPKSSWQTLTQFSVLRVHCSVSTHPSDVFSLVIPWFYFVCPNTFPT